MWTLTTKGMQPMLSPMLLAELAGFVTRHRPCGQLTGDATRARAGGLHAQRRLLLRRYVPAVGDAGGGDAGDGAVRSPRLQGLMATFRRQASPDLAARM